MIKTLYSPFRKWTERGTLWVYSDPHFSDPDMVEICYEKPSDFCHRHIVADWLTRNGVKCKEWEND